MREGLGIQNDDTIESVGGISIHGFTFVRYISSITSVGFSLGYTLESSWETNQNKNLQESCPCLGNNIYKQPKIPFQIIQMCVGSL